MATTSVAGTLICPQGHGPGVPGSRFCTQCGATLVNGPAPGQPASPGLSTPPGPATQPFVLAGNATFSPGPAPAPVPPPMPPQPPPVSAQPFIPPGGWQQVPPVAGQPYPPSYPPAPTPAPGPAPGQPQVKICGTCRNTGAGLAETVLVCPECAWLRPLLPGYQLDRSVFLWAQDGQAMAKLQSLPALHSIVTSISDKVGRPWIESTFNAIRLGPRQLPDIYNHAVLAARIMGLPNMPDVYVSGDQMWNTYTYGTEYNFFIVLGTSHLINFASDELLFVLAREMGHCRAGHALWRTVLRFIAGDTAVHGGLLSDGIIHALSIQKIVQGAVDIPLMAWARQSDITADRAGLLAVGDEALARRVLLAWAVRSARLLQMVNIEEWMKQEDASGDAITKVSEATTSSSMYTTRRLKLLRQSAQEPALMRWSASIQPIRKKLMPVPTGQMAGMGVGTVKAAKPAPRPAGAQAGAVRPAVPAGGAPAGAAASAALPAAGAGQAATSGPAAPTADSIRVICNKCQAAMRVPLAILRGKPFVNVRCPQCHSVLTLRPKGPVPAQAPGTPAAAAAPGTGAKPAVPPVSAAAASKPAVPAPASAAAKGAKPVPPPVPAAAKKPAVPPSAHAGARR